MRCTNEEFTASQIVSSWGSAADIFKARSLCLQAVSHVPHKWSKHARSILEKARHADIRLNRESFRLLRGKGREGAHLLDDWAALVELVSDSSGLRRAIQAGQGVDAALRRALQPAQESVRNLLVAHAVKAQPEPVIQSPTVP